MRGHCNAWESQRVGGTARGSGIAIPISNSRALTFLGSCSAWLLPSTARVDYKLLSSKPEGSIFIMRKTSPVFRANSEHTQVFPRIKKDFFFQINQELQIHILSKSFL